ncbi:transient receptor potential cation channel subfamily M member 2-like [Paramacrobiotus metropolitanus]|uniref:transient receptor potential cation channel subfamily M member 2-like n=1 Tax=Paramacrobiotus metropolitanus TaxID=2943436 RepID=UPI0024461B4A|nr:transient receptor potential cation channel subfamily M member 2-like [Paramacrobiotus metropolitanus]
MAHSRKSDDRRTVNGPDSERDGKVRRSDLPMNNLRPAGSVLDKNQPYMRINDEVDIPGAVKEILAGDQPWIQGTPDAIITYITGFAHFEQWKRDDLRSAMQGGFLKVINTLNVAVFDDGLQYGVSRLLGAAVREEEMYRLKPDKRGKPAIAALIGAIPLVRLDEQETAESLGRDFFARSVSSDIQLENVQRYGRSQNHSAYLYISQSYREAGLLRVAVEKRIQQELSDRASQVAERMGNIRKEVPLIAVLFQGEIEDLDRVKAYLNGGTPVIVYDGCGGLGDIIGSAVTDSDEMDGNRLRNTIEVKLQKEFPFLRQNETALADAAGSVLEILGLSRLEGGGGMPLLSVVNGRSIDTYNNLNSQIIQSAIVASSGNASPELFNTFLTLAIKTNKIDVARHRLLTKRPWSNMELPQQAFETALLLPGREAFVDTFLTQKFPVRSYLSHLKLLKLFREARDRQFFPQHVWEGILQFSLAEPISENFILTDLNRLIERLSGVYDYIDPYELSANAYNGSGSTSAVVAERKAMNALLVFAVFFNRAKLAKILVKHSHDPLLQALFAECLFHAMYSRIPNVAISGMVKNVANDFAQMSLDIFDAGVTSSPTRGHAILTRTFPDYNGKTPLEMAYDTNNKKFLAHNNVQSWLDQYYHNFIKVKGNFDNIKLFLSGLFLFPMYLWLTFPKVKKSQSLPPDETLKEKTLRPRNPDDVEKMLNKVKKIQAGRQSPDRSYFGPQRPSFGEMVHEVWKAPVVKFYTWHMFYWFFIIIICVDIMLPPCRYIGVDITVWVFTITMWLELISRTIYDVQMHRKLDWVERSYDLISQTLFNILFFLYRIDPYRYDHPFAGRVILAFGIIYYCYRVWGLFYYMERTIGPLIRVVNKMYSFDLTRWILLMAPMTIASTVIWMGVINPDWPMTGDDWRHAFYRGIFTFFGSFHMELEYSPPCEARRVTPQSYQTGGYPWVHVDKRTRQPDAYPTERCWSGQYDDYTCPTVSFWSYFFVIQFYILLKLGLMNMLTAFYVTRNLGEGAKAAMVWKYHRSRIIMDYARRTPIPPPFFSLGYIYLIFKSCGKKEEKHLRGVELLDGDKDPDMIESYTYWTGVTKDYFRMKEQQEAAPSQAQQQLATLTAIQESLGLLTKKIVSADRKVMDVDESTKQAQITVYDAAAAAKQNKTVSLAEFAQQWPHNLSRVTPYPGTSVARLFVTDEKVPWTAPVEHYRPPTYNKASRDFTASERNLVDPENDFASSVAGSRAGSVANVNLVGYKWNSVDEGKDGNIVRTSWITNDDKQPISYEVDAVGNPLNPFGRTGLKGRGALQRFGPNHKVIMVITTRVPGKGFRYIMQRAPGKVPCLPQSFLQQYDSEYAVGCLLIDAFLYDTVTLAARDLNVSTVRNIENMRNIIESVLKSRLSAIIDNFDRVRIAVRELYRGYVDNALNTDNAWLEAVVFHINLPTFGIDKFKNYRWRDYNAAENPLNELDAAAIRQIAVEWGL